MKLILKIGKDNVLMSSKSLLVKDISNNTIMYANKDYFEISRDKVYIKGIHYCSINRLYDT